MNSQKTFGQRLSEERKLKGFTSQKIFAKELGVSPVSISYWENDERKPDYEMFAKIADTLNVSYDYMLGKTESKQRENIDIARRTGLSDTAIQKIIHSRKAADLINDNLVDISDALNIMLGCDGFCDEFFPNFYRYMNTDACRKITRVIVAEGIATENTDGSNIFLLGMVQALAELKRIISKEGE